MPLDPEFRQEIIDYFAYRWQNDPNASYFEEEDMQLFSEMPYDEQHKMFLFFFEPFLHSYRKYFSMYKFESTKIEKVFYNRHDPNYS